MNCPNCGTENRDEVRFCRKCGHPLATPSGTEAEASGQALLPPEVPDVGASSPLSGVICPACGATAKIDARFCPRCGQVLRSPDVDSGGEPEPRRVGQTQLRMGSLPDVDGGEGFAAPQQPVPDAQVPERPVVGGVQPTGGRRRLPSWLWIVLGAGVLVAAMIGGGVLLLSLLNRDSPESTPEEVVPVVATESPGGDVGATATPETPTVTPEGTASPQATSTSMPTTSPTHPAGDLRVELDAMPNVPRVGEAFVVAALLVNDGEAEVRVHDYTVRTDDAPQLRLRPESMLGELVSWGDADDLPRLFVFDVVDVGSAQIDVIAMVEVSGADGLQEVISTPLMLEIHE